MEIIQRIRLCSKTDGFASFVARFVSFVACRRILREIAAVGTRGYRSETTSVIMDESSDHCITITDYEIQKSLIREITAKRGN